MSRRSLVTPLIVAVLVSVATGLTFSTAPSAPTPVAGATRTTTEIPVSGQVVGRGLPEGTAADLAEAFEGWRIDVAASPRRDPSPVVVIAVHAEERRWRPYLLRYAARVLPARTTVVFQVLDGDGRSDGSAAARRTATLLTERVSGGR